MSNENVSEAIIRKIQKLLALAESDNKHEAEAAATKASELLLKYNLDMQTAQQNLDYTKEIVFEGARVTKETKWIEGILIDYFHIKILRHYDRRIRETTVYFVGDKANVEVAKYVFEFLSRAYRSLWLEFKKQNNVATKYGATFYYGLTLGIVTKLKSQRAAVEQERGLVLVKDPALQVFFNKQFGPTMESNISLNAFKNDAVKDAAFKKGQELNIARGLNQKSGPGNLKLGYKGE